jgi:hypothetical protein
MPASTGLARGREPASRPSATQTLADTLRAASAEAASAFFLCRWLTRHGQREPLPDSRVGNLSRESSSLARTTSRLYCTRNLSLRNMRLARTPTMAEPLESVALGDLRKVTARPENLTIKRPHRTDEFSDEWFAMHSP